MADEVGTVDAMPRKRLFQSIIADYSINSALCELIDNVLDIWTKNGRKGVAAINVELNEEQQIMMVEDTSGGIDKDDLSVVVAPGATSNEPSEKVIGIFGVGTKRSVVALAQRARITTRCGKKKTHMVEIDDEWLNSDEWSLPVYAVDDIEEGSTVIELSKLRMKITEEVIASVREHLGATYAKFLGSGNVNLVVNGEKVEPITFDKWAYPPEYGPRRYYGKVATPDGEAVSVNIVAGLSTVSSQAGGEYGVYFYCNDRLIARGLKSYEVGFTTGKAGLPHASISLARMIVCLNGEAHLMPWNSSKSGISPHHNIFVAIRDQIVEVITDYSSLSRRFVGDWPNSVFKYTTGDIVEIDIGEFSQAKKSYLPKLPAAKPRYTDKVAQVNRDLAHQKPWTRGLYESMIAVDLIGKQKKLDQRNRICLILLDSTLEIAFKEYLVRESGQYYSDQQLLTMFRQRSQVHDEVKRYARISNTDWGKIGHYYDLRCKLVHERATVGITDSQIEDFRGVVQRVLKKLFDLKLAV